MNPLLMIAINFVIAIALFSFFRSIGWFTVSESMPLWAIVLIVSLINVLVSILVALLLVFASPIILLVACLTLGLGLLVLGPVTSYFTLYLTASITHLFTMTTIWWQALVIGACFGWLRLAPPSND